MATLFADSCEYVTDACVQGRLYDVGTYPAAIESTNPAQKVYGEVYRILRRDMLLAALDDYEGCSDKYSKPHLYQRKQLTVSGLNGDEIVAWIYLYNYSVNGLRRIESGDYMRYIEAHRR